MSEGHRIDHDGESVEYVTVIIGGQLFGLPIGRVLDVFSLDRLTRVPLGPPEVAGVLNLRGRIVTAIDMRVRLGLPPRDSEKMPMAVGIDHAGEAYGLLIDRVGEVMRLPASSLEPNPVNLDRRWAHISNGIHRLDGQLLVVFDVEAVLENGLEAVAA